MIGACNIGSRDECREYIMMYLPASADLVEPRPAGSYVGLHLMTIQMAPPRRSGAYGFIIGLPMIVEKINVYHRHFLAAFLIAAVLLMCAMPARAQLRWSRCDLGRLTFAHVVAIGRPGMVYAGTNDGLYRSTDNGASWTRNADGVPHVPVTALGARGGVVFAGTATGRLYRSGDDGGTWDTLEISFSTATVATILLTRSGAVLVGTWGYGLHRSLDGGRTWSKVGPAVDVLALAESPDGIIVAGAAYGAEGTLFRSTDDGVTWGPGLSTQPAASVLAVTASSGGQWAAGVFDSDPVASNVYGSFDGGSVWTPIGLRNSRVNAVVFTPGGELFAGASGGGYPGAATYRGVLRRSGDTVWTKEIDGLLDTRVYALAVSDDGELFAGTETGVFRSTRTSDAVRDDARDTEAGVRDVRFDRRADEIRCRVALTDVALRSPAPLRLELCDATGRAVAASRLDETPVSRFVTFSAAGLPSGLYFCVLRGAGAPRAVPFLVVR